VRSKDTNTYYISLTLRYQMRDLLHRHGFYSQVLKVR